ncbi:uncharacterized protein H6S33_004900 [Morchella sextelata]|uniref:uncharacterized protein n=1 Tax=Morchella sextelata TaxID=1174677 RepID=UPI001D050324|nr:uncharacterized protein H6S33_004900 [Morchella sextelata]KAH0605678.1 hypothetical protein H6S33_004900 [Morchella sextelata]
MTNPVVRFPSRRIRFDWALAVTVVLGALCKLGGSAKGRGKPRMVCVMYGTTKSGSPVLVCGTSKSYLAKDFKSKNEMSKLRWRQERLESLEEAIYGPSRRALVRTAGTGTPELSHQTAPSRNDSHYRTWDGDCAETVPMTVLAARCSGEVVSIAIRPTDIPDRDCNLSRLVHRMRNSGDSRSNFILFQTKACANCLRFFDLLEQKKGIRVVHERLSKTEYPLAFLDTGY